MNKTLKNVIKAFALYFAVMLSVSSVGDISVAAAPGVSAESAVVINVKTGEILFEKNSHKKHYPASCTKVMTGLLAVEYGLWDEQITMSHNAIWGIDRSSSNIALDVDEVVSFEQLMYGLMLASGNECAMAIAETVGGSVEQFADMMNDRARQLGLKDSNFVNPHGLFDENHYSTAYDIAIIMRQAVSYQKFVQVINTTQYSIPPTNKQSETRVFNNTHQMLPKREHYYESVIGGKTGWIPESKNNLITYAEQGGIELIVVTFGESGAAAGYRDTANLLDYFFENYEMRTLAVRDYINTKALTVELPCAGEVPVTCDSSIQVLLEKGTGIDGLKCVISPSESHTSLPVMENDVVGELNFVLDGALLGAVPLYASETMYVRSDEEITDNIPVTEPGVVIDKRDKGVFSTILSVVGYVILCLLVLLAVMVIAIMVIRHRNIKRMQRRRMVRLHGNQSTRKRSTYVSRPPYDRR